MQSVALGFVGLVLLAAGCSGGRGDITVPSGEDVDENLASARTSRVPLYYAGRMFDGLPLTSV
jgi:hypothetical protein